MLSDHAEYLGIADLLNKADPALLANPVGKGWYEAKQQGGDDAWTVVQGMMDDFASGKPKYKDPKVRRSVWDGVIDTASQYNDPSQRAFYYVRVIEIPKPRWTAYDAKFFNAKMPEEVPMTVQDRAYTSPIWYTP